MPDLDDPASVLGGVSGDTRHLVGGPIWRRGGKTNNGPLLVPRFARAKLYAEPFFGGGSIFWLLPPGLYEHEAVNDLDRSVMTFFRVLRDRTEELVNLCELTPYSRDEFGACIEHSDDELEEARRVWVRGRQGFTGIATSIGNWGRSDGSTWLADRTEGKLRELRRYAARLRPVAIDNVDCCKFIEHWGGGPVFFYCDPPYVASTRLSRDYLHEMTDADHRRLAKALHDAVGRGAKVAISGYPSDLYDKELFLGWRRMEHDVALFGTRDATGMRRTEVLWMSYPESEEISYQGEQASIFGPGDALRDESIGRRGRR